MKKRLILVSLGAMAVLIGVATFAANTAQWVNVTARVEKEIELACVELVGGKWVVDPDGCNWGVVFPQNEHEADIELTLSRSFFKQDEKSAVNFHVLWECKQDEADYDNDMDVTECRYELPDDLVLDADENWTHPGFPGSGPLDGNLRDYVEVEASDRCLKELEAGETLGPFDKDIEELGKGRISTTPELTKCFYHLVLTPPACAGHVNPFTDPFDDPEEIECHEIVDSDDPQDWERFVELGDNFKIQVVGFVTD